MPCQPFLPVRLSQPSEARPVHDRACCHLAQRVTASVERVNIARGSSDVRKIRFRSREKGEAERCNQRYLDHADQQPDRLK